MIQRIQTVYLLIVTVLQSILLFSSVATTKIADADLLTKYKVTDYWPMVVLAVITVLLAFCSIFLYRKRLMQIRVNIFNGLLLLALQGYVIYFLVKLSNQVGSLSYSFPAVFPILSVILTFLAIRNIGKDEALIKALDRIR